jgi:hypothetical protein
MSGITAQVVRSGKVTTRINYKPLPDTITQGTIMTRPGNNDIYGKYYALIIGINTYADPAINKSDKSLTDAELFNNVITTRYTFEKDNVSFLRDARLAEIKEALDSFSKKVGPADNFLIFYAGQGYCDEPSEAGFWLPSDAKGLGFWFIPSDEKESTSLAWLSNSTLGNCLRKINSKHTLLITNACFGGSLFTARSVASNANFDVNKLIGLTGRKAMTTGMFSNTPGQSDFFSNLSEKLGKNSEKYLPSEKLFISISRPVPDNTFIAPRFGEINNLGDEGGDFIFILKD